jgi:23S rRNA pseudouridine1911/1915/1917 synthase
VAPGDVVEFQPPAPASLQPAAEQIPLEVLYEDDDFLVVVKPAGMVVHPAPGHPSGTLVHALLGRGGGWSRAGGDARPGIVHRLDRGTSGLILAARTDAAHRSLSAQLATRTLSRTYLAVVRGRPAPAAGVVEGAIGRHPRDRRLMAVTAAGRFARTRYRVLETRGGYSLVVVDLDTGRTHQIRVHLAALGHPVAGDEAYGGLRPGEPPRPLLHATRLRLRHPASGEPLEFEAPPPADFTAFWESRR